MSEREELYTVKEIAEKYKVTEDTVREWIRAGQITAIKLTTRIYRVTASALKEFEDRRTTTQSESKGKEQAI